MDSYSNVGDDQARQPTVSYDDLINKDILELLGVKEMPDDEKEQLYKQVIETIQMRVLRRIEKSLSDEEIDKLTEFIEQKDREAFDKMLEEKNIDIGALYAEETIAYKAEMLALIQQKKDKKED